MDEWTHDSDWDTATNGESNTDYFGDQNFEGEVVTELDSSDDRLHFWDTRTWNGLLVTLSFYPPIACGETAWTNADEASTSPTV